MKKNIKLLIVGFVLLVTSLGVVYATVTTASSRKSPNLPWQGTPSGHYDAAHNVGGSNTAQSRFSFVNETTKGPNGIVKDSVTGLIWESEGSNGSTDSSNHTANSQTMPWTEAKSRCVNLTKGGHSDWRLPSIKELSSIVDYSRYSPAVDTGYFSLAHSNYWSSTTSASYTNNAWYLYFHNGSNRNHNKSNINNYVLCVR